MFSSKYHLKFQSNTIFAYATKYLLNNNTTHIPVSVSKTFVKCVIYNHPLYMLFSQPYASCVTKLFTANTIFTTINIIYHRSNITLKQILKISLLNRTLYQLLTSVVINAIILLIKDNNAPRLV